MQIPPRYCLNCSACGRNTLSLERVGEGDGRARCPECGGEAKEWQAGEPRPEEEPCDR